MIPFEEIDDRLKNLGKDRFWLAKASGRKVSSINSALAENARQSKRSIHVQRALSAAIEAEELARETPVAPPPLPDRITIEVAPERRREWDATARDHRQTTEQWAIAELNRAAEEWRASRPVPGLRAAEDPAAYPADKQAAP